MSIYQKIRFILQAVNLRTHIHWDSTLQVNHFSNVALYKLGLVKSNILMSKSNEAAIVLLLNLQEIYQLSG